MYHILLQADYWQCRVQVVYGPVASICRGPARDGRSNDRHSIATNARSSCVLQSVQTDPGVHPVRSRYTFLGDKWPWREADNPHPYSTEVRNVWSYTYIPRICLHGIDRKNLILSLQIFVICEVCNGILMWTEYDGSRLGGGSNKRWPSGIGELIY